MKKQNMQIAMNNLQHFVTQAMLIFVDVPIPPPNISNKWKLTYVFTRSTHFQFYHDILLSIMAFYQHIAYNGRPKDVDWLYVIRICTWFCLCFKVLYKHNYNYITMKLQLNYVCTNNLCIPLWLLSTLQISSFKSVTSDSSLDWSGAMYVPL